MNVLMLEPDYETKYQAIANLNKLRGIAGEILSREFMQPLGFLERLQRRITGPICCDD